ncbi:MAG: GGDEF domain-containing protein [Candidatus Baltobacteraceae bacterium]
MNAASTQGYEPAILRAARPQEGRGLAAAAAILIVMTAISVHFGTHKGAFSAPFLPMCMTLCVAADFLTAYFLFTQFSRSGTTAFLFIGAAYGITGLLSVVYLAFFPGVFLPPHLSSGYQQVSIYLWTIWHTAFPLLIGIYLAVDPSFKAGVSPHARRPALRRALIAILGSATLLAAAVFFSRAALPVFVLQGHFLPAFTYVSVCIFVLSATAVSVGLARMEARTPFQYWLLLAVLVCGLDALLNSFAPSRYSLSWYFGKIETLLTSLLVLGAMLGEVGSLYKRLSDLSTLDPLTGIRNRRGLDETFQYAVDTARRQGVPFGVLVIDIDHFKLYNDRYGHAAGDGVLRRVAEILSASLMRSTDSLARYGGEEFIVLLPGADDTTAARIAEHLRAQVQSLCIPHAGSPSSHLTVTIGSTGGLVQRGMTTEMLFNFADAALYNAKAHGRNCVTSVCHALPPLVAVAVAAA